MENELETKKPKSNTREYNQEYYQQNKDRWITKVRCDVCHKDVCSASMTKHRKSIKHLIKAGELTTTNELINNKLETIVNEVMKRMKNE